MPRENAIIRQAKGKIQLGIARTASKYPFHAQILEQFEIVHRPNVYTMGVHALSSGVRLLFNSNFVLQLPVSQLIGVLLHETHHVLFGHLVADLGDYPDAWARTVAQEVTVNEFITEPLPAGAITLSLFPDLPPRESTARRYRRLERLATRFPLTDSDQPRSLYDQAPHTIDNHDTWSAEPVDPEEFEHTLADVLEPLLATSSQAQLPEPILHAANAVGATPGSSCESIGHATHAALDWRHLLRRYTGQLCDVRPTYDRPNRRLPEFIGLIPGSCRRAEKPKVMAVVDTSGSISRPLLEVINTELSRMVRFYSVVVVECDSKIHKIYPYQPITHVHGRGGTDFNPPLQSAFLRRHMPDLIVYFTDGHGPAPSRPPLVPVVWCITPEGRVPAQWGRSVRMDVEATPFFTRMLSSTPGFVSYSLT